VEEMVKLGKKQQQGRYLTKTMYMQWQNGKISY